jgi:hypothetical protein
MKSQKPFTLLKRPPQGIWYYKLPGEKTCHSTGLTVKTQAEQYVVGILKGDRQVMILHFHPVRNSLMI